MTRADAKQKAVEMWGEMGVIGRMTAALVLIGLVWAGLTAAYGVTGSLFVKRPDFDRYVQQQDASHALHALRDSARQENTNRQLRYIACRVDHPRSRCLNP